MYQIGWYNSHIVTYQKMGTTNVFDEYFIRMAHEEEYHPVELIKYDLETDIAILKSCKQKRKHGYVGGSNLDGLMGDYIPTDDELEAAKKSLPTV